MTAPFCVTFFTSRLEELPKLTRDDPSAFVPPPAFGTFRVLHQVGVGALGPVFRTYEPTRDRLVAVKIFRLDITPEQAQALADELSKATEAGLFHPSIVEPIAAGVEGTVAYRAEEYVAAETLDVALRHYAPAPIEKVLPFITQLAGAIDFARTAGVGHGALHPRDIFVTPEEARASGFGVVEALERVGLRAPVRRPYTAPERVAGKPWTTPADVFSLAAIAYELLTARRPAGTGSQIGTVTGGPHAAAIHAALVQGMDEDPGKRPATALAFASALDAASRGEGPSALGVVPVAVGMPEDRDHEGDLDAEDDITGEREDDEAHAVLTLEDQRAEDARVTAPPDGLLFDDEAVEDLAIETGDDAETVRFADEFSPGPPRVEPARRIDEPPVDAILGIAVRPGSPATPDEDVPRPMFGAAPDTAYGDDPQVVPERGRWGLMTYVTVVLALLVGFAAGHAVGSRGVSLTPGDGTAAGTAEQQTGAETAAAGPAKPYSEEVVTPPAPAAKPADAPTPATESVPQAAAPTPDPPGRATVGSLDIRSTPSAAGVTVDGQWRGRTPLTVSKLRFGRHVVRVVQPGYTPASEEVNLSAEAASRTLSIRLARSAAPRSAAPRSAAPRSAAPRPAARPDAYTGTIYVDSRPRGARVLLDGKLLGTTPVSIPDVPIGSHVIRLQLTDHTDWTSSTRVTAGQESRVTGSLERIR